MPFPGIEFCHGAEIWFSEKRGQLEKAFFVFFLASIQSTKWRWSCWRKPLAYSWSWVRIPALVLFSNHSTTVFNVAAVLIFYTFLLALPC